MNFKLPYLAFLMQKNVIIMIFFEVRKKTFSKIKDMQRAITWGPMIQ